MYKNKIVGILGILAVSLGAFGSHALKSMIPENSVETFKIGVLYHFIHTIAIAVTPIDRVDKTNYKKNPITFFLIGILFFSGSLYLLSCKAIFGNWVAFLGPVTPIGGVMFIIGWFSWINLKGTK